MRFFDAIPRLGELAAQKVRDEATRAASAPGAARQSYGPGHEAVRDSLSDARGRWVATVQPVVSANVKLDVGGGGSGSGSGGSDGTQRQKPRPPAVRTAWEWERGDAKGARIASSVW